MDIKHLFYIFLSGICLVKAEDYMVFYGGMKEISGSDPIKLAYAFSSVRENVVSMSGPGTAQDEINIAPKVITTEFVAKGLLPDAGRQNNKNVLLSSSRPMTAFGHMYTAKKGQGALLAIPNIGTDSKQFIVTSFPPKSGEQSNIVIATREVTNVKILDTDKKEVLSKTLQARQIFSYNVAKDVSGYTVTANNPVSVIAGTSCGEHSDSECEPLVGYIPPVERLGKYHIIPQLSGKLPGSQAIKARVVAASQSTKVKYFSPFTNSIVELADLDAGEYYDVPLSGTEPNMIECSAGCLVSMYVRPFVPELPYEGSLTAEVSGPLMVMIPNLWKAKTDITFFVPEIEDAELYSLTIVTPKDKKGSLLLNDKPLDATWSDIGYMPLNVSGTVTLKSRGGNYRLHSTTNDVHFLAYLFVHGPQASYGGCLISFDTGGVRRFITQTTASTTQDPNAKTTPTTKSAVSQKFTLESKATTPTTTIITTTTTLKPKTTPTVEIKTVVAPTDDYDIDYQDNPDQPGFTRRPPTPSVEPVVSGSAKWKIAVIVVVFLLAIVGVVIVGYFLIQRSRKAKEKRNSYMGQAAAEFTPDGMVDSKITMGITQPKEPTPENTMRNTFRLRLREIQEVVINGIDTIRGGVKRDVSEV